MIELADLTEKGRTHWSAQIWGYDARQRRLVAYRFSPQGVSTKTVTGWLGGEAADHSWSVTEACRR